MATEIDSLEISIEAQAKQANSELDKLISKLDKVIKPLSEISGNKSFLNFANQSKSVSSAMDKIADSTRSVSQKMDSAMGNVKKSISGLEKPLEQVKKSMNDIVKEISDRTIDIMPELNLGNKSAEIKKYENQLRNSQNQLNRILESSTADKQINSIEKLVIKINEAKNALNKLNEAEKESTTEKFKKPNVEIYSEAEKQSDKSRIDEIINYYEDRLDDAHRTINSTKDVNYFTGIKSAVKIMESALSDFQNEVKQVNMSALELPDVQDMVSAYERSIQELSQTVGDISAKIKNDLQQKTDEFRIDGIKDTKKEVDELLEKLSQIMDVKFLKPSEMSLGGTSDLEATIQKILSLKNAGIETGEEFEKLARELKRLGEEKLSLKVDDTEVKKTIESVEKLEGEKFNTHPLEFSGNFFEMEKWIDGLQGKLEKLLNRQEKMSVLGIKPDSRAMQSIDYDIEQITKTLDKYELKLEEARKAGELEIKIPSIDAPINQMESKISTLKNNIADMKINISSDSLEEVNRQLEKVKQQYDALVQKIAIASSTTQFYGASADFKKKQAELSALRQRYQELIQKQKELSVSGGDVGKDFQQKLDALVVPEIKINEPDKLRKYLLKLESDLDKFKAKLQNDITMGRVVIDDSGYRKAQEQIALTEKSIEATKQKLSEVGTANTSGLEKSMRRTANSGVNLEKVFSRLAKSAQKAFRNIRNIASKGLNSLTKSIKNALSNIKKLITSFGKLNKQSSKSDMSFKKGLKTILRYGLGIRSLFVLFNRLRAGFKEGIDNLVQFSDEVNHSMSIITSGLGYLKNSFAVAFAPIVNVVAPYIQMFIDMMTDAFNAVGRFFSALTGKQISAQAKKYYKDYAESLDGVADSADKADKALHTLGIDELNILSENKTDKNDDGLSIEDMFENVPIESAISDWADRIRNAVLARKWNELGETIAEMMNKGLQKAYDAITGITPKIVQALENFAQTFNGFVNKFDFELLGRTIGAGVNLLTKSFNALTGENGIDFENLGTKLSVGFRGLVDEIEWRELGNALGNGFMVSWRILDGFITDMSRKNDAGLTGWAQLGRSLGDAVNGIAERINFEQIIRVLTEGFKGILEVIENFIDAIHWDDIIDKFNSGIDALYKGIHWDNLGGQITKTTSQITEKINKLADGIQWGRIGQTIGAGVNTIVNTLNQLIEGIEFDNIGRKISEGLNGIISEVNWTNLGNLIGNKFMIIPDIIYGVVSDFNFDDAGIAFGELVNGIFEKVDLPKIGATIGKLFTGIGTFLKSSAQTIKWDEIGLQISGAINSFFEEFDGKEFAEGAIAFLSGILDALIVAIQNIDWSEVWVDIIEFLVTVLVGGMELMDKILEAAFYLIKGIFVGLIEAITKIDWGDVWDKILKAFKIFFGIHSPSTVMQEQGGFLMQGLINGISEFIDKVAETFRELGAKISAVWDDVKKTFQEKWKSITDWWKNSAISKWWNDDVAPWFTKEKWTNLYDTVKTSLQNKWGELQNWWSNTNFSEWIDSYVKPFFNPSDWAETYDTVKTSLQGKWDELREWWKNTDFSEWIDKHVKPYFTKEKWLETYDAVKSGIEGKWKEMTTWWNNSAMKNFFEKDVKPWFSKKNWSWDGIKEGLEAAFNNALEAVKNVWNKFANWLNEKLDFSWNSWSIFGKEVIPAGQINLGKIPTFATGGFPEDGLFMANHTELVGQFANGRTAVANNEQIIAGIEEAAYRGFLRAQSETAPYLQEIADNTKRTADKDMSVRIGDRDIVDSYNRGKARNGFSFA